MTELLRNLLLAGLASLQEYVALHILTCLVPAFFLAGALVSFVRREAILAYLGEASSRLKSFSLAVVASFFVAACSCTVIPVSSGLYYAGAGIGAAFIVLWVAPAANILALIYTGQILGTSMVLARIAAALLMAFVVGWGMSWVFRAEAARRRHDQQTPADPSGSDTARPAVVERPLIPLFILLVLTLLAPNYLIIRGPYWQKILVWAVGSILTALYAAWQLSPQQIRQWMHETWWFVRIILPLLLVGVFVVGIIQYWLPTEWVQRWLGGNGLLASFLATLIGSISYFATMTEAPFVDALMKMGMGKGPALALLLTGPGLSLPNWLAIGRVFGFRKALVYVPTIVILGTLVGWLFGTFIL